MDLVFRRKSPNSLFTAPAKVSTLLGNLYKAYECAVPLSFSDVIMPGFKTISKCLHEWSLYINSVKKLCIPSSALHCWMWWGLLVSFLLPPCFSHGVVITLAQSFSCLPFASQSASVPCALNLTLIRATPILPQSAASVPDRDSRSNLHLLRLC